MSKYIVTGFVKRLGKRDIITKPLTRKEALRRKRDIMKELKHAIPKYKWITNLKVEKLR